MSDTETTRLSVDFSRPGSRLRPLHGVNRGPLTNGGTTNLSDRYREVGIPSVRLHDTPFTSPFTTDMAYVFPDFRADPRDPSNYCFAQTDDYIAAIRGCGADVVYRLGASIEHFKTKRAIHPPDDAAKWGEICVHIIRHYNEGWANGFSWGLRYWEIWNEPDIANCWTGTPEQFADLYVTASRIIKVAHPSVLVGGPAMACPSRSNKFMVAMLQACREHQAPLDFFSWHRYATRPVKLKETSLEVQSMLKEYGYPHAESHLNEWNLIPGGAWESIHGQAGPERRRAIFEELTGSRGAAFIASALILMQDAPIDVANFYTGDAPRFGLFDAYGAPQKSWFAFLAFSQLLTAPNRVHTEGGDDATGLTLAAGRSPEQKEAAVLVSNYESPTAVREILLRNIPWDGPTRCEVYVLDASHNLELTRTEWFAGRDVALRENIPSSAVRLLKLRSEQPA